MNTTDHSRKRFNAISVVTYLGFLASLLLAAGSLVFFVVVDNEIEALAALDPGTRAVSQQAERWLPTFPERGAFVAELEAQHARARLLHKELRNSMFDFRSFALASAAASTIFCFAFAFLLWRSERNRTRTTS